MDNSVIFPNGQLGLIVLDSIKSVGQSVDSYLVDWRYESKDEKYTFQIPNSTPRFGTGEGKCVIEESVRGKDIYILVDVCNSSISYTISGKESYMSPDDHFQDVKRVISAISGKARKITVIMPFLYEGRQHRRVARESLDCALALQELVNCGVSSIITFDAHDPEVQNSIPLCDFISVRPTYQFLKAFIKNVPDAIIDNDNLLIISPDEGAMERTIFFANVIGIDVGMFYKRRDYSKIVNGRNPIVAHEYLGQPVENKDVIIFDDMVSSGDSLLDVARQLKKLKARNIYAMCPFGLFTNGMDIFDKAYEEGLISKVFTTNLVYQRPELFEKDYYVSVDLSKYIALIIDTMNKDQSITKLLNPVEKIHNLLEKYNKKN